MERSTIGNINPDTNFSIESSRRGLTVLNSIREPNDLTGYTPSSPGNLVILVGIGDLILQLVTRNLRSVAILVTCSCSGENSYIVKAIISDGFAPSSTTISSRRDT
jgi:hypothetical protein